MQYNETQALLLQYNKKTWFQRKKTTKGPKVD